MLKILLFVMTLSLPEAIGAGGVARSEESRMVSTAKGLDLTKVHFGLLFTNQTYYQQFLKRALERFERAGLHLSPYNRKDDYSEPLLLLTLRTDPIEGCPGKVLYWRKLELREKVFSARTPPVKTFVPTWSYGLPEPTVEAPPSIEELATKLDKLIDGFIEDYKLSNGIP